MKARPSERGRRRAVATNLAYASVSFHMTRDDRSSGAVSFCPQDDGQSCRQDRGRNGGASLGVLRATGETN
jgi:hypothetical protein